MLEHFDQMTLPRRLSLSGSAFNVIVVAALLVVAGLSAVLIPAISAKYCIGFAGLAIAAFVALRGSVRTQAFVLLLFITFPVVLRFAGSDALATGTLVILLCLALNMVSARAVWTREDRLVIALLVGIMVVAGIGAVSGGGGAYWGQELRHWLSLAGGVAGFLLVIGWARAAGDDAGRVIDVAMGALVGVLALHVVLSLVLQRWPGMEHYLSVFMYTGQQSLTEGAGGEYTRATTIFARGEGFGELLLLVFPFSLYKLFRSSLAVYLPLTLLLLGGVVASGTRSAILLVSLQLVLFGLVVLSRRVTRARSMVVLGFAALAILVFAPLFASSVQASMQRFDLSAAALEGGSGLTAVLNRSLVWPNAIQVTTHHISIFGYGPVPAYALGIGEPYHFHSLYLTLIFEFGILGTAVWMTFFIQLGARLFAALGRTKFRSDPDALLLTACLISLFCFLLNEIKFEFNRSDSFQQFVWLVFAVMYASAFVGGRRPNEGGVPQVKERESNP